MFLANSPGSMHHLDLALSPCVLTCICEAQILFRGPIFCVKPKPKATSNHQHHSRQLNLDVNRLEVSRNRPILKLSSHPHCLTLDNSVGIYITTSRVEQSKIRVPTLFFTIEQHPLDTSYKSYDQRSICLTSKDKGEWISSALSSTPDFNIFIY